MRNIEYKRENVYKYAEKWAYLRNSRYYNFDKLGGDCTNFASQCIYAGCSIMNYDKNKGWYYNNINDRATSWTGVQELYNFLINNKSVGPYAKIVEKNQLTIGDLIQLSFTKGIFSHSLIIVGKENEEIFVATHTYDSFYRNVSSYNYEQIRYLHIEGVRNW